MARLPLVLLSAVALWPSEGLAQQRVRVARPATADGVVRIHNVAGSVTVTGWDRDSIAIEGTVPTGAELVFQVAGGSAKLGVWPGEEDAAPAQLQVRVPARSRVWVQTTTADVSVSDVRGGVDVNSVSGRIELRGEPAETNLESIGGSVLAELFTRVLRVRTAGGDITVRGRIADAQVYTVSGVITVHNKEVARGRFESVDGGVNYRGGIARASTIEFVSHSGAIDVALPAEIDAEVRISSYQGAVMNQLGGRTTPVAGSKRDTMVQLGRGGAEVIIRTFKGSVQLRKL